MTIARWSWVLGLLGMIGCLAVSHRVEAAGPKSKFKKGDRIVVVGDALIEQMGSNGYLETLIHTRLPEHRLSFSHLGQRPSVKNPLDKALSRQKADVIVACFSIEESLKAADNLDQFAMDLPMLIDHWRGKKYNDKTSPRIVLVSPMAFELKGGQGKQNQKLTAFTLRMGLVATLLDVPFIDLFKPTAKMAPTGGLSRGSAFTKDGSAPSLYGHWEMAHIIADRLAPLADGDVVNVDFKNKKIKISRDVAESATFTATGFKFFMIAEYLPPPSPPAKSIVHKIRGTDGSPPPQQTLIVTGLPDGQYALRIDGQKIIEASAKQWAAGVALVHTPGQLKTQKLRDAVIKKNGLTKQADIIEADADIATMTTAVRTERWHLAPVKK